MNVQLREIDVHNWEQCIELSVYENQKGLDRKSVV